MGLIDLIKSDFLAYNNSRYFIIEYLLNRGLRITTWLRLTQFTKKKNRVLYLAIRFIYSRITRKYGVHIPVKVPIGKALRIFHGFGLVLNSDSVLGNNIVLQHEVTLAGNKNGAPTIGNNVQLMPGSKIIGKVTIGDNVIVGANCVVTKDIPNNAVVAGVPFKILYYQDAIGNKIV